MPTPGTAADPALQALVEQVRAARADGRRLRIHGGQTKAFYGERPEGEPLDVRPLRGISAYEPSELVVTVRAGTPLAELEAALAAQGQHLAFEPPRFAPTAGAGVGTGTGAGTGEAHAEAEGGTVGGMVAAGLAGPSRMACGGVRDHVLGATVLNGRAELLSFGGQVMKNVAGYDVSRLMVGSLGTLGVLCEVSLKVLPTPPAVATLRFEWPEAQALAQLQRWGALPLPIHAAAWWSGMLVLRLAGAQAAVAAACRQLGGDAVPDDMATPFWTGLRDHRDEFFQSAHQALAHGATLWRLALPVNTPALPLPGEHLVEWGGAQRWVVTSRPAESLRALAAQAGGHATAFAGRKTAGAFTPLPPAQARIQQRLQQAFDPDGVFDRGRLGPAPKA